MAVSTKIFHSQKLPFIISFSGALATANAFCLRTFRGLSNMLFSSVFCIKITSSWTTKHWRFFSCTPTAATLKQYEYMHIFTGSLGKTVKKKYSYPPQIKLIKITKAHFAPQIHRELTYGQFIIRFILTHHEAMCSSHNPVWRNNGGTTPMSWVTSVPHPVIRHLPWPVSWCSDVSTDNTRVWSSFYTTCK